RSEVIPHGVAVRHVDRFPSADRQERPETEAGHTFHIAFRVAAGIFVEERIDRGGHERTVAAVAGLVNLEIAPEWTSVRRQRPDAPLVGNVSSGRRLHELTGSRRPAGWLVKAPWTGADI